MKKWRHISVWTPLGLTDTSGSLDIFPADLLDLDWLFVQFPKIKKSNRSEGHFLSIDIRSHLCGDVLNALMTYLGDNGWEYCGDNHYKKAWDEENS